MQKLFTPTAILFIIFFGGYFVYNEFIVTTEPTKSDQTITQPKNTILSETSDEVTIFLNSFKKETQINFSDVAKDDLKWLLPEGENVVMKGKKIVVTSKLSDSEKIDTSFLNNGFTIDINNIADGTISSLSGYKKENMVCTVLSQSELNEKNIMDESTKTNFEINCGLLKS